MAMAKFGGPPFGGPPGGLKPGGVCPVTGQVGATCPVARTGGLDFTVVGPDGTRYPVKNMLPQMPIGDFNHILRISGVELKKEWRDVVFFSSKSLLSAVPRDSLIRDCIYKSGQQIYMSYQEDIQSTKRLLVTTPIRPQPVVVHGYHPSATVKALKKELGLYIAPGKRYNRRELHLVLTRRRNTELPDNFVLNDLKDGDQITLQLTPPKSIWSSSRLWLFVAVLALLLLAFLVYASYRGGLSGTLDYASKSAGSLRNTFGSRRGRV